MKVLVKNTWVNGVITEDSLFVKLGGCPMKAGETKEFVFADENQAKRFISHAKDIGFAVSIVSERQEACQPKEAREEKKEENAEEKEENNIQQRNNNEQIVEEKPKSVKAKAKK